MKVGAGIVGAVVALEYAGFGPFSRSKGVSNIEDAWSRGGGGIDHTPAIASKRGDPNNVVGDHGHQGGYGNPTTRGKISEMKDANRDNVVSARQRPIDRDTPSGPGYVEQSADQSGHPGKEPLTATSSSESKR